MCVSGERPTPLSASMQKHKTLFLFGHWSYVGRLGGKGSIRSAERGSVHRDKVTFRNRMRARDSRVTWPAAIRARYWGFLWLLSVGHTCRKTGRIVHLSENERLICIEQAFTDRWMCPLAAVWCVFASTRPTNLIICSSEQLKLAIKLSGKVGIRIEWRSLVPEC